MGGVGRLEGKSWLLLDGFPALGHHGASIALPSYSQAVVVRKDHLGLYNCPASLLRGSARHVCLEELPVGWSARVSAGVCLPCRGPWGLLLMLVGGTLTLGLGWVHAC